MSEAAARLEISDPQAYRAKLDGHLAGRDPIEVLAQTPDALARLLEQYPPQRWRERPFAEKWTPLEILGHLLDCEWTFGYRMRAILCDDEPQIVGMDQERWVARQAHNEREPAELLDAFRALRRANVALWRRMNAAELGRIGRHNERGPESLGMMLNIEAGHDLSHIDQIKRYLASAE